MIYFLHIAYNGSSYRGWQRQPDVISVQAVIEDKLQAIFKKKITVYGCGRTDAGVHASQYFCHIHLEEAPVFDFKFRLNKNLPYGIAVFDILEMPAGSHTRHDAIARTYDYFIHSYKDPVLGIFSSYYDLSNIDFGEMQKATQILGKHDDFRSICLTPDAHNTTICHVANTSIYLSENRERIQFSITANRFLRGMVRACVHFILEVGNGKMACEELDEMLAKKTPYHNKRTALPNGLYLAKVEYPYLSLETKESFGRMLRRGLSE